MKGERTVVKNSGKCRSVQDLSKQRSLLPTVPKRINVPGYTGPAAFSKRLFQEMEPKAHLINDSTVMYGRLVVHAPTTVHKLKAPY